MLLDWGVHLIDQIMWMIKSPVVSVYTHMLSVKFSGVDDNFKLLLRFENGLSALVEVDTYTFIPLPRWHVSGDRGTMQVDSFDCTGRIVRAKTSEMRWGGGA
jgi:scyllo-inositol 2-dehydrogenase (NADP+)